MRTLAWYLMAQQAPGTTRPRRAGRTFRRRMLRLPGRLVRTARRWTLRLPPTGPGAPPGSKPSQNYAPSHSPADRPRARPVPRPTARVSLPAHTPATTRTALPRTRSRQHGPLTTVEPITYRAETQTTDRGSSG
jgi:hypothetical protein